MRLIGMSLLAMLVMVSARAYGKEPSVGSKENPIRVKGVEMEKLYCHCLRTADGEKLEYSRVGSVPGGPNGHMLDLYKLKTKDGKQEWQIYIDMYHPKVKTMPDVAPPGLLTLQQFLRGKVKDTKKQYIGLSLPRGCMFRPLVVSSPDGQIIVARIVPTKKGRDIQVLKGDGTSWSALGTQGNGLTREANLKGFVFLDDMRYAPDGALWVMALYSLPDRFVPYRFDGKQWARQGPEAGYQPTDTKSLFWSAGLLFDKKDRLYTLLKGSPSGLLMATLFSRQWKELKVVERIASVKPPLNARVIKYTFRDNRLNVNEYTQENLFRYAHYCKTGSHVWLYLPWYGKDKTLLSISAIRITGTNEQDVAGPIDLFSANGKQQLAPPMVTAVFSDRRMALTLQEKKTSVIILSSSDNWQAISMTRTPALPHVAGLDHLDIADLEWSLEGELHAVLEDQYGQSNRIVLLRFEADRWETLAEHSQPISDGFILSPKIFFLKNRKPIVVWKDFFP